MRKSLVACLCVLLLGACHFHHRNQVSPLSAPVEQTVLEASPAAQPAPDIKTVQVTPALPDLATQTPTLSTHAEATPEISSPVESTVLTTQEEQTVSVLQQPTFQGEETIDTTNRLLHPFARLAPDHTTLQQAPWAYEQLKYGLYYTFIKAGTAYIHNRGLVNIHGRPAYLLQTTAFSASVIDAVFKVRDINQSWLDASEFYSYGYGQSVREGNYKRDEWLVFDYPEKQYTGQLQKKEAPKTISGPLDIKVLDMLSSLYYVRAQKLKIGHDIIFDIVNREKQYPLVVKVLKKDTVKTAAGKFNCIVVEPQLRGEGIFVSKGKSLKVWLTDDEYKMPVKMQVEVFIGSVSAELLEYQRQAPTNIL